MRFIIFYNNHPKVQRYDVRAWDNATAHPNYKGEMTHPEFVRHYHFDFNQVTMMGDIIYNKETNQWDFDAKRPVVFLGTDEKLKLEHKKLALQWIRQKYGSDEQSIQQSLKEQIHIIQQRENSYKR